MFFLNGFLLGLSTGIFCTAYCLPIYLPQIMAQRHKYRGWNVFLQFNIGRLVAYIIFGAVFGYLGAQAHSQFLSSFARLVIAALAVLLILYGLGLSVPRLKWCAWTKNIRLPLVSGFLLGINICPPFLLALTQNFQTGGVINGIVFFLMFFLGTTVYLVPFTFLGSFTRFLWLRQAGRLAAIVAGVIMIGQIII